MYISSFNYLHITLRRKIEADNRWIYGEEDVTMTDVKKKKGGREILILLSKSIMAVRIPQY